MVDTIVPVSIADAATYTVLSSNTGVMHYFPDFTATCTATLPTPKAGLWFEFAYSGVAADAQNFVLSSGSNTNYFKGGLAFLDNDTDVVAPIAGNGSSNSKLTVVTPAPGTRFRCECADGTTWVLSGFVGSATIPTFGDQ
jgi:hypothetical protein